jgi:cysteine desulfurase family protein
MRNTYFDNGATSFPKPQAVADRIYQYLTEVGGTYGRSAYGRVMESSRVVETVRDKVSEMLGVANPEHLVFTNNATSALNTIIFGLQLHDCHILISPLEHNSVVRPVEALRISRNITYDILPHGLDGVVNTELVSGALRKNTRLVILNHQSNVNGCIQPVQKIKQLIGDIPLLLDLAQSLGHEHIDLDTWQVDLAAFTGHKGLLGPTGTGGFFIRNPELVSPLFFGGTGSRSESFDMPSFLPDKFEAGTPNVAGLFGLLGALENPQMPLFTHDHLLTLLSRIESIPFLKCFKALDSNKQGPLFSLIHRKFDCSHFANALYTGFQIETRSGLHCAPLAHSSLGTFPDGTVRVALSPFHTEEDLNYLYESLLKMEKL